MVLFSFGGWVIVEQIVIGLKFDDVFFYLIYYYVYCDLDDFVVVEVGFFCLVV